MRSAEHLKAPEYEFRKTDIVGNRVYLFEERLKEGWQRNSAHALYQVLQFVYGAYVSSAGGKPLTIPRFSHHPRRHADFSPMASAQPGRQ